MLATDDKNSVLSEVSKSGRKARAYSAYGYSAEDASTDSGLGYNGELRDATTGHYLLGKGYRVFSPQMMRFYSPDSWSPFGEGGVNAYTYVSGNPMMYSDPTGHSLLKSMFAVLMLAGDDASDAATRTKKWVATLGDSGDVNRVTNNLADLNITGRSRARSRARVPEPEPDYSPSPDRGTTTIAAPKSKSAPQSVAQPIAQKQKAPEMVKGAYKENRRNFPETYKKLVAQSQPGVVVSKKLISGMEQFNLERIIGHDPYFDVAIRAKAMRKPEVAPRRQRFQWEQ